ncbi:MAG: MFS transporter [Actinomycetes bacterium]
MSDHQHNDDYVSTGLPPVSPFTRFSRIHALMTVGETTMAIALADSLFLSISPDAARTKVILFLAVSIAPFAVVSPFVGPFVDRMKGGHRAVVILVGVLRAVVLIAMAWNLDSLTLFPLAFGALILGKTYAIAKSAIVPSIVKDEEKLVASNSKLGQVAGITGFVIAVPAGLLQLISSQATLIFGSLAFVAAALNAYRLPRMKSVQTIDVQLESEELHSISVVNAANAMRILRGIVGFMFFHLAFWLRGEDAGTAWFGFAVAMSGLATLAANFAGPTLRSKMRESIMLMTSLVVICVVAIFATWYDRVVGGILLAAVVNAAAAIGRLAFESTVQSGAPDANRGRAFAKFETQNQMAWVLGGLIPVAISPSGAVGFAIVAIVGVIGAVNYARSDKEIMRSRGVRAINRVHRPR